jgi:hypothetical protein
VGGIPEELDGGIDIDLIVESYSPLGVTEAVIPTDQGEIAVGLLAADGHIPVTIIAVAGHHEVVLDVRIQRGDAGSTSSATKSLLYDVAMNSVVPASRLSTSP